MPKTDERNECTLEREQHKMTSIIPFPLHSLQPIGDKGPKKKQLQVWMPSMWQKIWHHNCRLSSHYAQKKKNHVRTAHSKWEHNNGTLINLVPTPRPPPNRGQRTKSNCNRGRFYVAEKIGAIIEGCVHTAPKETQDSSAHWSESWSNHRSNSHESNAATIWQLWVYCRREDLWISWRFLGIGKGIDGSNLEDLD